MEQIRWIISFESENNDAFGNEITNWMEAPPVQSFVYYSSRLEETQKQTFYESQRNYKHQST